MSRGTVLLSASCLLLVAQQALGGDRPVDRQPPNIVFFLTDNQRWDALGCAGNRIIQTPNIDRLAARGIRFTHTFSTTAICAASRASIFTGQFRRTHGYTFRRPPMTMERLEKSYPALLRAAGYRTGFVGKIGINMEAGAAERMFDVYKQATANSTHTPYYRKSADGSIQHLTRINGDEAVRFLAGCKKEQPFCLSVSFSAPHPEDDNPDQYIHDRELADLYEDVTIPPPRAADPRFFQQLPDFLQKSENRRRWFRRFDTPEKYQTMMKRQYRMITGVDLQVGRILKQLERLGFAENTVVIFGADNGIMTGEHGLTGIWLMYEGSLRLPLIIHDPRWPAARRDVTRSQFALNIDIAPTMLEMAGVEVPETMQGRSLVPLFAGETNVWREDFFHEHLFIHDHIPKNEGVRDTRWKYVRYFEQDPVYEQLFDLDLDPDEVNNLVGQTEHQKKLAELRARCDALRDELGGPYQPGM